MVDHHLITITVTSDREGTRAGGPHPAVVESHRFDDVNNREHFVRARELAIARAREERKAIETPSDGDMG